MRRTNARACEVSLDAALSLISRPTYLAYATLLVSKISLVVSCAGTPEVRGIERESRGGNRQFDGCIIGLLCTSAKPTPKQAARRIGDCAIVAPRQSLLSAATQNQAPAERPAHLRSLHRKFLSAAAPPTRRADHSSQAPVCEILSPGTVDHG